MADQKRSKLTGGPDDGANTETMSKGNPGKSGMSTLGEEDDPAVAYQSPTTPSNIDKNEQRVNVKW